MDTFKNVQNKKVENDNFGRIYIYNNKTTNTGPRHKDGNF